MLGRAFDGPDYGESVSRAPIRFDDRVAIVTGAGRGLGREHALFLASRGAAVVVNDVAARHADETAADIVAAGGHAVADHHSVVDAAAGIVRTALDTFGGLHVVLNNAGRGGPTGTFVDTTDEQVRAIVDSHLVGTWNVCRAAWPHLVAQGFGRILVTSSSAAIGSVGMPAYSMAKAGLIGLVRSLANEGRSVGVTVNCLMPIGYTRSGALNPHEDTRRWMEANFPPSLCAHAAAFLVHDGVPCTGELLTTGAGRTARVATVGSPGWSGGPTATIEELADNWPAVVDLDGQRVLMTSRDDLVFYEGDAAFPG